MIDRVRAQIRMRFRGGALLHAAIQLRVICQDR